MKYVIISLFGLISAAAWAAAPATGSMEDKKAEATATALGIENCPKCMGPIKQVLPGDQQHKTIRTVESLTDATKKNVPNLNDTGAVPEG